MKMNKMMKAVVITKPDGSEQEYISQSFAAREINIRQTYISQMCRGVIAEYHGFKARFLVPVSKEQPDDQPGHTDGGTGH